MDTMLELLAEKAQLEARLAKLNELIRKNRASKSQRNQYKSIKGRVKSLTTQINAVKPTRIREARIKKIQVRSIKVRERLQLKQPTMTREQVMEIYRQYDTERFLERVFSEHPALKPEEGTIRFHLNSASRQELYDTIKKYSWHSTWFDSDGSWDASEIIGWNDSTLLLVFKSLGAEEM